VPRGLRGVGAVGLAAAAYMRPGPGRIGLVTKRGRPAPDDLQGDEVRVAGAGQHADVAGPARGAQDIPRRPRSPWVIPAGHHNVTRSPNAAGVASTYPERAEDLKRIS
jgi:hypothetical protein